MDIPTILFASRKCGKDVTTNVLINEDRRERK